MLSALALYQMAKNKSIHAALTETEVYQFRQLLALLTGLQEQETTPVDLNDNQRYAAHCQHVADLIDSGCTNVRSLWFYQRNKHK